MNYNTQNHLQNLNAVQACNSSISTFYKLLWPPANPFDVLQTPAASCEHLNVLQTPVNSCTNQSLSASMPRSIPDKRTRAFRSRRKLYGKSAAGSLSNTPVVSETSVRHMSIKDMPSLIARFATETGVAQQYRVVELCLQRILHIMKPGSGLRPHPEQVRVVRRLIYGKGDTLFIARTGFGKSLVLQSYSILTGQSTLQIVPLDKLREE